MNKPIPLAIDRKRFWSRVEKSTDGCWTWIAAKTTAGYGVMRVNGSNFYAHRLSHFIVTGEEPKHVMHTCDNPSCVNPKHLLSGCARENSRDAQGKGRLNLSGLELGRGLAAKMGRLPRGEQNHKSKLTEPEVIRIRNAYSSGKFTQRQLAKQFGVCQAAIYHILKRNTWGWL